MEKAAARHEGPRAERKERPNSDEKRVNEVKEARKIIKYPLNKRGAKEALSWIGS